MISLLSYKAFKESERLLSYIHDNAFSFTYNPRVPLGYRNRVVTWVIKMVSKNDSRLQVLALHSFVLERDEIESLSKAILNNTHLKSIIFTFWSNDINGHKILDKVKSNSEGEKLCKKSLMGI